MLEALKHSLGLCGEPHPSLVWLLGSGGLVLYIIKHNVKWCWKRGCDFCRSKLLKKTNDNDLGTQ
jgi:hypothetical protein